MIYVYAITDVDCDFPPELCGLDGRPALWRTLKNVAIVYGEVAGPRVEPSAENLWQHEAVVEAVMRRCEAVLPVRFGMTFGDEAGLDEVVARHASVLATGLERVRGCVEMGVRVSRRRRKRPRPTRLLRINPAAPTCWRGSRTSGGGAHLNRVPKRWVTRWTPHYHR